MKKVRLADRERGSEFSGFERRLIFDPSYQHFGYVKYVSSRHFILRKSLFTDIDTGIVYRLPDGLSMLPDEGSFVEVEPDHVQREIKVGRPGRGRAILPEARSVTDVGSFIDAKVPLPSPELPVDEFLYRVSVQWRNAEDDLLDRVIGLTLVSAPFSVYGRGGLGSEGLERSGTRGKGSPRDVSNSIMGHLPVEFRTSGSRYYRYRSLDTIGSLSSLRHNKVREECYSIIRPRRMKEAMKGTGPPVQLPFVIHDSSFMKKEQEFDLDVLDYQLTALYMPPPPEKTVEELALRTVKEAHQEAFFDMPGIGEPDPLAAVKLGLAVSRLHIGKQFTGSGYSRTRTDPSRGKKILDLLLKKGLETVRERIMEEEMLSKEKNHPWASRLKPLDRRVYFRLRSAYEENGVEEMPLEKVMPDVPRPDLEVSLDRLNRYGYVLFMKGGTVIKVVVSSSVEPQ